MGAMHEIYWFAKPKLSAMSMVALATVWAVGPSDADTLEIKSSDAHALGYPTTDAIQYMGVWLSD